MDPELIVLAVVGSSLLAGTAGVVWGRGTVENVTLNEGSAPMVQLETVSTMTSHVHECNHQENDGKGWRCYQCWRAGVYTPMERAVNNRG